MAFYAKTAIKHNGEFIKSGTKLTASMLPKTVVKRMVEIGSVIDYDPNPSVEEEVEEVEEVEEEEVNEESNESSDEGTKE